MIEQDLQEPQISAEEREHFWQTVDNLRTDLSRGQRKLDAAEDRRTDMFLCADAIDQTIEKVCAFRAGAADGEEAHTSTAHKIFGSDEAQQMTLHALEAARKHIRHAFEEYQRDTIRDRLRTAIALSEYSLVVMGRFLAHQRDATQQS